MNPDKKRDLVKTGVIAAFFLIFALVMLNYVIGSVMEPPKV